MITHYELALHQLIINTIYLLHEPLSL